MAEQVQAAISRAEAFVDSKLEPHEERIKEAIRIPSIAAEYPEKVRDCAALVRRWFEELGCADTGIYKTKGSPVVFGHYAAAAKNTLLVYMVYDAKQVLGEVWTLVNDPFDPQVVPIRLSTGSWWEGGRSTPRAPWWRSSMCSSR